LLKSVEERWVLVTVLRSGFICRLSAGAEAEMRGKLDYEKGLDNEVTSWLGFTAEEAGWAGKARGELTRESQSYGLFF